MRILGVIPARGGSKGVPGKNIKLLGGKPLLYYTLEAARDSKLLTSFIVSTDSEAIASCAKTFGVDLPFLRPPALSQDDTPTLPVIQHVLEFFRERGEIFDAVCLLQATSPFRLPGFIDRAVERFMEMKSDALISVLPVPHEFNPHWLFEPSDNGFLKIATGEATIITRRQDLPPAYFRDGSIYLTRTEVIERKNSLYGESLGYLVSQPEWYVNIDTQQDWIEAEQKVKKFSEECARLQAL